VSVAKQGIRTGLDALFLPDSVAVIGATERTGAVGRTILENCARRRLILPFWALTAVPE
jgi:acyl-CoA synthetase (NDP forming)